jgi:hypothetical protein
VVPTIALNVSPTIDITAEITGPHDYGPWNTVDKTTLDSDGQPLWLNLTTNVKRGHPTVFPGKAIGWTSETMTLLHTNVGQFIQEVDALHFSKDKFPYVSGAQLDLNTQKGDKRMYFVVGLYGGSGSKMALSNSGSNYYALVACCDPDDPSSAAVNYKSVPISRNKVSPTGFLASQTLYDHATTGWTRDVKLAALEKQHYDRLSTIAPLATAAHNTPPPKKTPPKRESTRRSGSKRPLSVSSTSSKKAKQHHLQGPNNPNYPNSANNSRLIDLIILITLTNNPNNPTDLDNDLDGEDAQDDTRSSFHTAFDRKDVGSMKLNFDLVHKELEDRNTAISDAHDEIEEYKNAAALAQTAISEGKRAVRAAGKRKGGEFSQVQMDTAVEKAVAVALAAVAKASTKNKTDVTSAASLRVLQSQVKVLEANLQGVNSTLVQAQAIAIERSHTIVELQTKLTTQQKASFDALLRHQQSSQQGTVQAMQNSAGSMAIALLGAQAVHNKMTTLPSLGGMNALLPTGGTSSSGTSHAQPPASPPPPPVGPKFCAGCGHNLHDEKQPIAFCPKCARGV